MTAKEKLRRILWNRLQRMDLNQQIGYMHVHYEVLSCDFVGDAANPCYKIVTKEYTVYAHGYERTLVEAK